MATTERDNDIQSLLTIIDRINPESRNGRKYYLSRRVVFTSTHQKNMPPHIIEGRSTGRSICGNIIALPHTHQSESITEDNYKSACKMCQTGYKKRVGY